MRQMALPRGSRAKVLPLRGFRGYAQLGGAGSEQARRALGAGRAGMDAIDRDPMTAQWTASVFVMCTRPALRAPPLRLPALRALPPLMLMMRPQPASS
jgi:hypothetical protein